MLTAAGNLMLTSAYWHEKVMALLLAIIYLFIANRLVYELQRQNLSEMFIITWLASHLLSALKCETRPQRKPSVG